MPTMTNPNPCIGSAVLDNATDGSALFRQPSADTTPLPRRRSASSSTIRSRPSRRTADEVGEVFLRVTDRGELVELSVTDSGSGIADLGAGADHLRPLRRADALQRARLRAEVRALAFVRRRGGLEHRNTHRR